MTRPAIRVENLGKQYQLGIRERAYTTFREAIVEFATAPWRRFRHLSGTDRQAELIWALRDVAFEVQPGEVVGVIGRNGAGKSTLLKILTRITEPTVGRAEVRGHVGSLLEVGTGFHPELTGRENVFLNGAILGMRRAAIKRQFDRIVAFSGVEKFLDTPVKHYSSGMTVRLAFAVAAHLEPEILLIDEVLAVGDAEFQKRCLGKMGEVAGAGRTVLFVSHNMAAVSDLCTRGIMLDKGTVVRDGPATDVVAEYLMRTTHLQDGELSDRRDRRGSGRIRFTHVGLVVDGRECGVVQHGQDVTIEAHYEGRQPLRPNSLRFGFSILTVTGVKFLALDSPSTSFSVDFLPARGVIRCTVPRFPLINGRYQLLLYAGIDGETVDRIEDAFQFEVLSGKYPEVGYLNVPQEWSVSALP